MNNQLEKQVIFQTLGNQAVSEIGYTPTVEERITRLKLALEELTELAADGYGLAHTFSEMLAIKIIDINKNYKGEDTEIYNATQALDATVDIAVINNGTIITNGHQHIFDDAYDLVDANNKTKFHTSIEEAEKTQDFYLGNGVNTVIETVKFNSINFYVCKDDSGKVRKPYNYESVDLSKLINKIS